MVVQKNLKPYRPFGNPSSEEGLEQLPNESVIIPSPPGPKHKSPPSAEGDSFNAQPRNEVTKEGVTFKEIPTEKVSPSRPDPIDSTETKPYFPPTQPDEEELTPPPPPPTPLTPIRETPVKKSFVVGGKNSAAPAAVALIGIILVAVFAVYAYFEIQPKLRSLSIIKGLETSTKNLSQSVGQVDEVLSNLVGLIGASEAKLSTLPSPAEDEYVNALRVLKETAQRGKSAVIKSEKDLETFRDRIPEKFPESVKDIVEEAQSLSQRSAVLLLEVRKVTDYYNTISSIQIDLLPTIKSLLTLAIELSKAPNPSLYSDKLNSLKQTISSLETQTRSLNVFLPEGLEKVQDDKLAVFVLLSNYLKDLEETIGTGSFRKFAPTTQKLGLDLEVITTRAKTLELSYWQETGLLKKTKAFPTDLSSLSSKLLTFRKNNRFPFFNN